MKQYISLLRGINVSGQKKISMAELARCYDACGFETVRTYIQSGNVLFKSAKPASQCREEIERGIREAFGFDVLVRVLDLPELKAIRSALPFGGERVFLRLSWPTGPPQGLHRISRSSWINGPKEISSRRCPERFIFFAREATGDRNFRIISSNASLASGRAQGI
jgi:hypothetical protein